MPGEERRNKKVTTVTFTESPQVHEIPNSQQAINDQDEPESPDSDRLHPSSFLEEVNGWASKELEEEARQTREGQKPWGQQIRDLMKNPGSQFRTALACLVLSLLVPPLAIAAVILFISAPITAIMQAIQKRRENLIKNSSSASLHATHQESELKVIDQGAAVRSQKDDLERPRKTGGGPVNSVRSSSSSLDRMNNP